MTKPTPEQIQRACDLLNAASGIPNNYNPRHYGVNPDFTALADTIAQLEAMQAERDKAQADLGEAVAAIEDALPWMEAPKATSAKQRARLEAIAAPYRVETDLLVEALVEIQLSAFLAGRGSVSSMKHGTLAASHAPTIDTWRKIACSTLDAYEPELAKRGLEIGRSA